MDRFARWLLFAGSPMLAGIIGVAAGRWLLPNQIIGGIFAAVVTVTTALLLAWGNYRRVRAALSDACAAAKAGRPPLREPLPGLMPLLVQLREVEGRADVSLAELRRTHNRLAAVLQGMTDAVLAVDSSDRVLFANRVAIRMLDLGNAPEGRQLLQAVRDHRLSQMVSNCRNQAAVQQTELDIGDQLMEVIATPQSAADSPRTGVDAGGVILVFRDLSQLKRLESVRRDFVANVSHELKTPLSNIKLYSETLANGAVDDPRVRDNFLDKITQQADRLHELIMDLIQLARIESSNQTFELTEVRLAPLIRRCLSNFIGREDRPVHLQVDVAEGLTAYADEEGVRQIIENLLSNAWKYTPEGEITIRCRSDDDAVRIEVADTGIGIAEQHLERLFERFYRVDRARARELGGTGLGLAIVKHLASAFEGQVGVESTLGAGSTFWVELPARAPRLANLAT